MTARPEYDVSERIENQLHSSHWGVFLGRQDGEKLVVVPHPDDPAPSPLLNNIPAAVHHRARVRRPMVRKGWLDRGPGPDSRRGRDEFVAVEWDRILDLTAGELGRVRDRYGPQAVYGGSYGWGSAGRFHHAQSQIHRFLNTALGGFVRSVNNYSAGAALVILPRVIGPADDVSRQAVNWPSLVTQTDLVISFGGMATKNTMVSYGGASRHVFGQRLEQMHRRGTEFVLVSPLRDDLPGNVGSRWLSIVPGTDTALMLALAHTLVTRALHDRAFLDAYCEGYEAFESYLLGRSDGQAKDAAWASAITGIPADDIDALGRRMAGIRPGVAQLSTGAWYDPDDANSARPLCVHGNPNVLTRDVGTSSLAQGCSGALVRVEIERFGGPPPPIRAFDPPGT